MVGRPVRRIVIQWARFLPYSYARLRAVRQVYSEEGVEVFGLQTASTDAFYADIDTVDPYGCSVETLFKNRSIDSIASAEMVQEIHAYLDRIQPEAVAIAGYAMEDALACLLWCLEKQVPAVVMSATWANDFRRRRWRELLKSTVVRQFDAALVGGAAQRAYMQSLGIPSDRIFTGYNVVDNEYFAAGAKSARDQRKTLCSEQGLPEQFFLACGRFVERKNFARLLEAFRDYRRLRDGGWDLVMVGGGPMAEELRQIASDESIVDHVHFRGFCAYKDLPALYGLADAFICPSTNEQWGLVVNEAMASGLPVIVSTGCGCAPELALEGKNGYLIDPFDIASLTSAMLRLSDPAQDIESFRKAAEEHIAKYTPMVFAKGLRDAIAVAQARPARKAANLARILIHLTLRSSHIREPMT